MDIAVILFLMSWLVLLLWGIWLRVHLDWERKDKAELERRLEYAQRMGQAYADKLRSLGV